MMIKQCVICLSLLVFGTAAAHAEDTPLLTARHMSKWEEIAVKEAKKVPARTGTVQTKSMGPQKKR